MLWMCDRLTEVLAATLKVLWWRKSYALELKKKNKQRKKLKVERQSVPLVAGIVI